MVTNNRFENFGKNIEYAAFLKYWNNSSLFPQGWKVSLAILRLKIYMLTVE
jgi:hypothetical protein